MPVPAVPRAVTGAVCCIACIPVGRSARALPSKCWTTWMVMRPGLSQWLSRSMVWMPTAIWSLRRVYTVWCVSLLSMPRVSVRHPLYLWMLCRISKEIWMWILMRRICASILIEAVVPVASTSTRHHLLSVSLISRREQWCSVRTNEASSRTRIRQCRCWKPNCIC